MEKLEHLLFRYIIKEEGDIQLLQDRLKEIDQAKNPSLSEIKEKKIIESSLRLLGISKDKLENQMKLQEGLKSKTGDELFEEMSKE